MELFIAIATAITTLVTFGVFATAFGADSRDSIGDDHGTGLTPRWQ